MNIITLQNLVHNLTVPIKTGYSSSPELFSFVKKKTAKTNYPSSKIAFPTKLEHTLNISVGLHCEKTEESYCTSASIFLQSLQNDLRFS